MHVRVSVYVSRHVGGVRERGGVHMLRTRAGSQAWVCGVGEGGRWTAVDDAIGLHGGPSASVWGVGGRRRRMAVSWGHAAVILGHCWVAIRRGNRCPGSGGNGSDWTRGDGGSWGGCGWDMGGVRGRDGGEGSDGYLRGLAGERWVRPRGLRHPFHGLVVPEGVKMWRRASHGVVLCGGHRELGVLKRRDISNRRRRKTPRSCETQLMLRDNKPGVIR